MDKKQYEVKRAELLAKMKAAIEAEDVAVAQATNEEIKALDAKFQALATAQANFAALNGMDRPATVPEIPAALNSAGIPAAKPAEDPKADDEKMYVNAFAHYMMGDKLSADEEKIFAAKNATTTAKENYVVVPTTVRDGIWHEMEERHPVIAATARTHIKGDVDILVETSVGSAPSWYDEDTAVTAEKAVTAKITLKGCELAKDIPVSWKLKKMSVDEFISYIQTRIADKMGNGLAAGLLVGLGVDSATENPRPSQPLGVITKLEAESGTPQVVSYTAANGIVYANLTGARAELHLVHDYQAVPDVQLSAVGRLETEEQTVQIVHAVSEQLHGFPVLREIDQDVRPVVGGGEFPDSSGFPDPSRAFDQQRIIAAEVPLPFGKPFPDLPLEHPHFISAA